MGVDKSIHPRLFKYAVTPTQNGMARGFSTLRTIPRKYPFSLNFVVNVEGFEGVHNVNIPITVITIAVMSCILSTTTGDEVIHSANSTAIQP